MGNLYYVFIMRSMRLCVPYPCPCACMYRCPGLCPCTCSYVCDSKRVFFWGVSGSSAGVRGVLSIGVLFGIVGGSLFIKFCHLVFYYVSS